MADGATDVSCLELEIVWVGFEMTTLQSQKESLKKKTVKVVSQRSRVWILYKPEFFSVFFLQLQKLHL